MFVSEVCASASPHSLPSMLDKYSFSLLALCFYLILVLSFSLLHLFCLSLSQALFVSFFLFVCPLFSMSVRLSVRLYVSPSLFSSPLILSSFLSPSSSLGRRTCNLSLRRVLAERMAHPACFCNVYPLKNKLGWEPITYFSFTRRLLKNTLSSCPQNLICKTRAVFFLPRDLSSLQQTV